MLRKAKVPSSSRVLSVAPAPQSLQADLLDTTDTTLKKTEKYGRLANLNFRTITSSKDTPELRELKLALASVRGDIDIHTLQNASLKDVLPLIHDKPTRDVYLRYIASLNNEETQEEGTPSWSQTSSEVNIQGGQESDCKDLDRNHHILNVGSYHNEDSVENVSS